MTNYDVLVDSDAFIGYIVESDAHHHNAKTLFNRAMQQRLALATTNYVIAETASTLSRRFTQTHAKRFMDTMENFLTIYIPKDVHLKSSELFKAQDKNKTSFVDMSNVVVMKHFAIKKIFAFDKIYVERFSLPKFTQ
ncbi:MAG: hypothetical protein AAFV93_13785 [Chloroflexota bacterium]